MQVRQSAKNRKGGKQESRMQNGDSMHIQIRCQKAERKTEIARKI